MVSIKASKLISVAESYVGYLEKRNSTAKYLTDDKSNFYLNVGANNYTLFGDWFKKVKGIGNPNPWCAFFVSFCFYKATGNNLNLAKELLGGDFYSYCPDGVNRFKNKDKFFTSNPKVGDVIFYTNGIRAYHTGLVYKVDSEKVYTIEGNTSSSAGVVENGGCVAKKAYNLNYSKILGYGRPDYDKEEVVKPASPSTTITKKDDWVARLQKEIGAKVDNSAGTETYSKVPTIKRGDSGKVVELLQEKLKALGYADFEPNGKYGKSPYHDMYDAVIKYQKEVVGLKNPDGEFTANGASWKALLGIK
jgi:hypothetical protein